MQLDRIIINPRVRGNWSAVDLGFIFARRLWWPACILYVCLTLPVLVLGLLPSSIGGLWTLIVLWWFKPLFERPILYLFSRALFAQPLTVRQVLGAWREWLLPGTLRLITTRRLNPARGLYAPISLLEPSTAAQYSARAQVLGLTSSGAASGLTIVLYHCEAFLTYSCVLLLVWFGAADLMNEESFMEIDDSALAILGLFSAILVAPFYVGAGFMLYIARRIELEGWDIEITFRDWINKANVGGDTHLARGTLNAKAPADG